MASEGEFPKINGGALSAGETNLILAPTINIIQLNKLNRDGGNDNLTGYNSLFFDLANRADYTLTGCEGVFGDDDGSPSISDREVYLNIDSTGAVSAEEDMTGASRDAGFTESHQTGGVSFDAGNDEEDFTWTRGTGGNFARINWDTAFTNGVLKVHLRNMVYGGSSQAYAILDWGAVFIKYRYSNQDINSVINTDTALSSIPTDLYFKITRINNYYKTEYSLDDSVWVTVDEGYLVNANASAQPYMEGCEQAGGGGGSNSTFSMAAFQIWTDFYDSGTLINSSPLTLGYTGSVVASTDVDSDTPGNTSITMGGSVNNGSNYANVNSNKVAILPNTGTQGILRATLAQTSAGDDVTPTLVYAGGLFG